jgi:hypothetical protein
MASEMTVKERAFARLIIEGTKTAAYRTVYSSAGTPATQAVNAYKLSREPKIKAEVARLLRQRECPADDYARIREMAVAGLTEIFIHEPDPRVRMKVGSILLSYADAGLKLHPTEKERKYDELAQFLRNAVGERGVGRKEQEPLVVDGEPPGAEPNDSAAETPENADEWEPDPVAKQSAAAAPDALGPALEELVPKMEYRLAPIPGAFPMRFRRVKTS